MTDISNAMNQANDMSSAKNASKLDRPALSLCAKGWMYVGIGGFLTFALARWPSGAGTIVVAFVFLLTIVHFIQKGCRPSFSMKALALTTGLIACAIALVMIGDPWKVVHRFPGYEGNVVISPDGNLVAASQGTSIEIRETQTGRSVQTFKMPVVEAAKKVNQKWAFKMRFSKDAKSLMTVDWQTSACLLDVATGKELQQWPNSGICPLAESGTRFIANSAAGTNTARSLETCDVYDVELVEPILAIETNFPFCRFISPTGSHVLVGKNQTTAELWNVDERRLVGKIPIPLNYPIYTFAKFTSDGKYLAVTTSTGVAVWDITNCQKVAEWNPPNFDHQTSLEWSPDGSRLVASYIEFIGPSSGPAVAAAAATGTLPRNAIEHSYLLDQYCREIAPIQGQGAAFTPAGDRIATINPHVQILDAKTGELLTLFAARSIDTVYGNPAIQFSPDGNWLVVNGDPTVYRRTRPEFWYSIYQVPAFWGMVIFLTAAIVQLGAPWVQVGFSGWKLVTKKAIFRRFQSHPSGSTT